MKKLITVGWHEWIGLPNLNLPAIKAKIDTGAKTSALHAYDAKPFRKGQKDFIRFKIHPLQNNKNFYVECVAPIVDERRIMSSNGHVELRYIISTTLCVSDEQWDIELSLSNRDPLRFRMLLGRDAMKNRILVNPSRIDLLGKKKKKSALKELYNLNDDTT